MKLKGALLNGGGIIEFDLSQVQGSHIEDNALYIDSELGGIPVEYDTVTLAGTAKIKTESYVAIMTMADHIDWLINTIELEPFDTCPFCDGKSDHQYGDCHSQHILAYSKSFREYAKIEIDKALESGDYPELLGSTIVKNTSKILDVVKFLSSESIKNALVSIIENGITFDESNVIFKIAKMALDGMRASGQSNTTEKTSEVQESTLKTRRIAKK